jgi:hypothetical protein
MCVAHVVSELAVGAADETLDCSAPGSLVTTI